MVLYWVKGKRKQIDWLQETQEPKMDWNIGSKIVGFITLGCTVLGIAMLFQSQILLGIIIIAIGALVNFVQFKITGKKWWLMHQKWCDWIKEEKETKKLTKFFRDEASSLHEKIVSGEIDLNHIEDGIHELRRKLRWLGIYSSALLG